MAKTQWTQEEKADDQSFKDKVYGFKKNELKFSVPDNLKRLNTIRLCKDPGVYNLCITAFVEGYFRDICNIDFDKKKDISQLEVFRKGEAKLPNGQKLTRQQQEIIHYLYDFMKTKTKDEKTGYDSEGKSIWTTTDYYVCSDRVRHCFANQDPRNIPFLVQCFTEFTKIYDIYNDNKNIIDGLIKQDSFFDQIAKRQKDEENEKALQENGESFIDKINNGTEEEKKQASEDFALQQKEQAIFAKSWRDYQNMMSNLSKEQRSISNHILKHIQGNKPIKLLIKGGPGTGKTLILLNVLQNTLDKDINLLTYTTSLTKYNEFLANTLCFDDKTLTEDEKSKINNKISTFDEYFKDLLTKELNKKIIPLNEYLTKDIIVLCKKYEFPTDQKVYDYIREQAKEIWLHLPKEDEYIKCTYSMGKGKDNNILNNSSYWPNRKKMWDLVKEWSTMLNSTKNHCIPFEYAYYLMHSKKADAISNNLKSDYLLIDEIQDLEAAKMETIQKFTRKGYIFTGDMTQSVFVRKALPWGHLLQLKVPELKQKLVENFRSTSPIQNIVNEYRNKMNIKDKDIHTVSNGFIPGPLPEGYLCKNKKQAYEKIIERINYLNDIMFFDNKEICIIVPNNIELDSIQKELQKKGINSICIEDESFNFADESDAIKLSKMKYVKGIDIPALILLLDKDYVIQRSETNDDLDSNGQENSLYASMARAMNILNIFFVNDDPSLLTTENAVSKLYGIMKTQTINL